VELLAAGRTAEVYALDDERVLKLDRPEWFGLTQFEASVLQSIVDAGLPAPRPLELVTVNERSGLVLDRIHGETLLAAINREAGELDDLVSRFLDLQAALHAVVVPGLPDLVERLGSELVVAEISDATTADLVERLDALDDGRRTLCHFDYWTGNVLVAEADWFVVDWLGAALGPPLADTARSLVLAAMPSSPRESRFVAGMRAELVARLGPAKHELTDWIRIVAAARLAEGADWLRSVAVGEVSVV
jgi:aminoglycoside phosphotransferase (APT) family kinase protein